MGKYYSKVDKINIFGRKLFYKAIKRISHLLRRISNILDNCIQDLRGINIESKCI
jgi:hypothetical protein